MKRTICALCLLALFVAYQASVTAFTHVHYVNGVLITHSHPFHNQHSHSATSLIVIGLLSHFSSDKPDCCEIGLLRNVASDACFAAGARKCNRHACRKRQNVPGDFTSRSPPVSLHFDIFPHERRAFTMPALPLIVTVYNWFISRASVVRSV